MHNACGSPDFITSHAGEHGYGYMQCIYIQIAPAAHTHTERIFFVLHSLVFEEMCGSSLNSAHKPEFRPTPTQNIFIYAHAHTHHFYAE